MAGSALRTIFSLFWLCSVTLSDATDAGSELPHSAVSGDKDVDGGVQFPKNLANEEGARVFVAKAQRHGGNTQERTEIPKKNRFVPTRQWLLASLPRRRMSSTDLPYGQPFRLLAGAMIVAVAASVLSARLDSVVDFMRTAAGKKEGGDDHEEQARGEGGAGRKQSHDAARVQLQAGSGFLRRLLRGQLREQACPYRLFFLL
ncbi:hypothetical protein CSUI_011176 [Cystoisospora suis]|uniref:Transmembrane protein n=1 Tax=Cystoisospora suis TaxID=483139 RepID=A0A2C6KEN3_9APIC|nr:hypothetical protein CSUI_011176 [Cystoisospora suis]